VWRKADGQEEGGIGGGTSMTLVTGDGNGEGEAMGIGRFQRGRGGGGEVAPRCRRQDTAKSGLAAREVEDDQMKSGQWVEWAVGLNC
jgi:hypothetical protein